MFSVYISLMGLSTIHNVIQLIHGIYIYIHIIMYTYIHIYTLQNPEGGVSSHRNSSNHLNR